MAVNFKFKVPKFFKSVKYCLAAVNGVFLLTGILLLIVGVVVLIDYQYYEDLITNRFSNIPGFVIATAVFILLGTGLGFYGAISEHFYFIAGYVVLLLVVLVFEIAIVITAFALKNDTVSEIRTSMRESLQLYRDRVTVAEMWDNLHMTFECCGIVGRNDFISSMIPVSCCHMDYGTISPFECNTANSYNIGCADPLGEWLSYRAYVIGVSALVCLCLQVIITSLAGWLAWRSKFEEVELES